MSTTGSSRNGDDDAARKPMAVAALDLMQQLPLTHTGRPTLYSAEVEIYSEDNITLYDHYTKTRYQRGRCSLTTHRLFFIDSAGADPTALFLPLEWVVRTSREPGFLARSAKIRLDVATTKAPLFTAFLKLSFKDGGRDDFYNPLVAALARRAWKDVKVSHLADRRLQTKRQFRAEDAGIAGILRRQQEAQKETAQLAEAAFSDLANLMEKARDMVGLMERYMATVRSAEAAAAQTTDGEQDRAKGDDVDKLSTMMLDMGITSPVTRENAGSAYYEQLARQLAEFVEPLMTKNGGIMTLSDIFCMFNRARGVEMVSPDDLYQAAALQSKLRLGYHLRKFEGGLLVLQADSHREDRVASRLETMAQKSSDGFITISDVAVELHTSFPLAMEYLKVAEEMGKLCRDETFEGTNFFPNQFAVFSVAP